MYPVPHSCPICGHGDLVVSKIDCPQCQTSLTGQFYLHRFNRLTTEQLQFIETFVTCEGKITRVEDAMGISYQAVRSRLHEVITALGGQVNQPLSEDGARKGTAPPAAPPASKDSPPTPSVPTADQTAQHRRAILAKVSAGELTAAQAAELLKK